MAQSGGVESLRQFISNVLVVSICDRLQEAAKLPLLANVR